MNTIEYINPTVKISKPPSMETIVLWVGEWPKQKMTSTPQELTSKGPQ
jgi:hypothetical protein